MIKLKNVSKFYYSKGVIASGFNKINLEFNIGEFVAITGESGSGKSTILNILTKLLEPTSGNVTINGTVGYMFQKDHLLEWRSIMDNITLGLEIMHKKNDKKSMERIERLLKTYGLWDFRNMYPKELSGGMRQRANFMRTFINSSDIMLLDEPFGALDSITRASMQNWLLDIKKQIKSTILLITHDIDEAIILSDRIYILSNKPSFISKELFVDKSIYNKDNLENIATLKKEILNYL